MTSVEDSSEREFAVLSNNTSDVTIVRMEIRISGFMKAFGESRIDRQAHLFASEPYKISSVLERMIGIYLQLH